MYMYMCNHYDSKYENCVAYFKSTILFNILLLIFLIYYVKVLDIKHSRSFHCICFFNICLFTNYRSSCTVRFTTGN